MARPKGLKYINDLKDKYWAQLAQAAQRNIEWLLTFESWYKIWLDSEHLHERGPFKGQYVMARFGDTGPYAIGNVKIITNTKNQNEAHLGRARSEVTKALLRERGLGRLRSVEAKQKTSATLKANTAHVVACTERILAQTKKNIGSKRSAETKQRISIARREGHQKRLAAKCFQIVGTL